jgi:UDP-glucose 4-epimerase
VARVLVTGGAGFLGSHVAEHCLASGHTVAVLDDLSGGFIENVPLEATFVEGSITDAALIAELFEIWEFEYVFHLAAYAAEGLSHFIRRFNYQNNVVGSVNLINEAVKHGTRRFVFTSSIAVYGAGQIPFTEATVPAPEDPYGIAKLAVELDLKAAHEMFGMDYTIFRPFNIYGPRQNLGDRYRNVIGIFIRQLFGGMPLTIFGSGEQTRAFTYVDDVAPHIADSIGLETARNETFNIGAGTPYTVNALAGMLSTQVTHLPSRKEVEHAVSTCAKAHAVFGPPETELFEGLAATVEWARQYGIQKSRASMPIEITKNLPESWRD